MKKLLFLTIIAGLLFCGCKKEPGEQSKFKVNTQEEVVAVLNEAATALETNIIDEANIDMRDLRRLRVDAGQRDLENAIRRVATASERPGKRLRVTLPEIAVEENAKMHWGFYFATQGGSRPQNSPSNAPGRKNSPGGGNGGSDNALLTFGEGATLHFTGSIPASAVLNIDDLNELIANAPRRAPARKNSAGEEEPGEVIYPITADNIFIDSDGMNEGDWPIFEFIKPDTVRGATTMPPGVAAFRGLARNVVGRTRSDRVTPFLNAQHVMLEDADAAQMQIIEFEALGETNPNARIRFRETPRMDRFRADTLHLGGHWAGEQFIRHERSWGHRVSEAHFTHATNLHQRNSFIPRHSQHITIAVPEYVQGVNDSLFYEDPLGGTMRAWIELEEIAEILGAREFPGGVAYTNNIRFRAPAVLRVPERPDGTMVPPSEIFPYLTSQGVCWIEFLKWAGVDMEYLNLDGRPDVRVIPVPGLKVRTR